MAKVTSHDGTTIAYETLGQGQPLILVDGAFGYRAFGGIAPLAKLLSPHFTVYMYDRRGRGESTNTLPYAIEREIEDLEALINAAGGSVYLYGISSGAVLAMETTNKLPNKIKKLALYEAPFIVDNTREPIATHDYEKKINDLIAANRKGDAIKMFMKAVEAPAFFIMLMSLMPVWSKLKAVAHTLPYDTRLTVDFQHGKPLPTNRWTSVTPPTVVIDGGKSEIWMRNGAQAVSQVLPNASYRTLEGQTHIVKPEALAPVLVEFFNS